MPPGSAAYGCHNNVYMYIQNVLTYVCISYLTISLCAIFIGVMAVTAFSSEHNVVTVLCEDDTCADVLAKLSQVAS